MTGFLRYKKQYSVWRRDRSCNSYEMTRFPSTCSETGPFLVAMYFRFCFSPIIFEFSFQANKRTCNATASYKPAVKPLSPRDRTETHTFVQIPVLPSVVRPKAFDQRRVFLRTSAIYPINLFFSKFLSSWLAYSVKP